MKAQRRHELQTNALAEGLANLPEFWNKHGTKVLMVLVAIALVIVLIRYRISSAEQASVTAADDLATARSLVNELETLWRPDPEAFASARTQFTADALSAIDRAMTSTDDPKILAEATLVRGDLYWVLANQPELPGAATRPALKLDEEPSAYLAKAEEAYQQILNRYSQQKNAVISARFGLAAIAENRENWDAAAKEYEAIAADKDALKVFQDQARARQATLKDISQPIYIAPPTTVPAATRNFVEIEPAPAPTTAPAE